jgi:bacterioferritin-associated ferredoxin
MIICICNNVSDREIRRAVQSGLTTMRALRDELGVSACCGKCHGSAKAVLNACLEQQAEREQALAGPALTPA